MNRRNITVAAMASVSLMVGVTALAFFRKMQNLDIKINHLENLLNNVSQKVNMIESANKHRESDDITSSNLTFVVYDDDDDDDAADDDADADAAADDADPDEYVDADN